MKVYCFYLIIDNLLDDYIINNTSDSVTIINGNKAFLYAWTNKKQIKKKFMVSRNMEMFYVVKANINSDFINRLYKYEIIDEDFYSIDNNGNPCKLNIPITKIEYHKFLQENEALVDEVMDFCDFLNIFWIVIRCLKDKWANCINPDDVDNITLMSYDFMDNDTRSSFDDNNKQILDIVHFLHERYSSLFNYAEEST